jgi:hypothetical protein
MAIYYHEHLGTTNEKFYKAEVSLMKEAYLVETSPCWEEISKEEWITAKYARVEGSAEGMIGAVLGFCFLLGLLQPLF